MDFFDINNIAFEVLGYGLSYIELVGTLFGFVSVILAARASVLTWPTGIVNEAAFFILFYQVQLYSDMYLQVFFFGVTVYGWYYWKNQSHEAHVKKLSVRWRFTYAALLVAGTVLSGLFMSQIHLLFPVLFSKPASYPFADAFTTTASILATILLSRKRIETWVLWILVDAASIVIYFLKGIHLVAVEYVIFLIICIVGYVNWKSKV